MIDSVVARFPEHVNLIGKEVQNSGLGRMDSLRIRGKLGGAKLIYFVNHPRTNLICWAWLTVEARIEALVYFEV